MNITINATNYMDYALYGVNYSNLLLWSIILIPVFVALWTLFIQKDLTSKMKELNQIIKEFKNKISQQILERIKNIIKKKDDIKAVEVITGEIDNWQIINECIGELEDKRDGLYKWGKGTFIFFVINILFGFFTAVKPHQLIGDYILMFWYQIIFLIMVFVFLMWLYKIIKYTHQLNNIIEKGDSGINEMIEQYRKKLEDETENYSSNFLNVFKRNS